MDKAAVTKYGRRPRALPHGRESAERVPGQILSGRAILGGGLQCRKARGKDI